MIFAAIHHASAVPSPSFVGYAYKTHGLCTRNLFG